MPAGYAATTNVESTLGDRFTAEITDLRITESLPGEVDTSFALHVMPETDRLAFKAPRLATRRPSNIIPIGAPAGKDDVFYLGLDLEFVGTDLGHPHMPAEVVVEVRFFLEAYGTSGGVAGAPHRHEINITPQKFTLNANPYLPLPTPDSEIRHQLWVQVARSDFAKIIEAPDPATTTWEHLFTADTIFRVAASVKVVEVTKYVTCHPYAALTGFIEGLVMQTEAWDPHIRTQP